MFQFSMRNGFLFVLLSALLMACGVDDGSNPRAVAADYVGTVERLSPEFDAVVVPGRKIEKIAEGFGWADMPAWSKPHGKIVFTDTKTGNHFAWSASEGLDLLGTWAFGKPVLIAGLATGPEGNVYYSHATDMLIGVYTGEAGGRTITVGPREVPRPGLKDIVVASDGTVYAVDMAYGAGPIKPGITRIDPSGNVTLIANDVSQPNGIALSPDGRFLYVSDSGQENLAWKRYDLTAKTLPVEGEAFHDPKQYVTGDKFGWVDGMAVDTEGRVYAAGPDGGVYVLSPDGALLGIIRPSQTTSHIAFGDDGSTLYMTAGSMLTRIRLNAVGAGFPEPKPDPRPQPQPRSETP